VLKCRPFVTYHNLRIVQDGFLNASSVSIRELVRQQCGSMQCAAFSVYSLGSCIIFAKDSIEHERKQDSEHNADLQINGITDFVMLSAGIHA
jgi:hypothetical protein